MNTETEFTVFKKALFNPIGGSAIAGFIFMIVGMLTGVLFENTAVMRFFIIGGLGLLTLSVSASVLYLLYKVFVSESVVDSDPVKCDGDCCDGCCLKRKKQLEREQTNDWLEQRTVIYLSSPDEFGNEHGYNSKGMMLF